MVDQILLSLLSSALASAYVSNLFSSLLYDSSKKIYGKFFNPYSKAYSDAIKELNKKYKVDNEQIETFLHRKTVKAAIKEYLKNPNKSNFTKSLTDEFLASFYKENFSREDSISILGAFVEILDAEIEKNPELKRHRDSYRINKIDQGVQELSQELHEVSEKILEIHGVLSDDRKGQTLIKESDTDFEESIKRYLNRIVAEDGEIGISEVYTELSAKEILPIILKFRDENNDKIKEFNVLELVKKEEKLIISGESGSGKTTTLKWLNFIYAKNHLEKREEIIPLCIELNSYIKGSFYDYILIRAKGKGISEDNLKILFKGRAIILLDGLDLLSPTDEFFPYEEIYNFISEYSNCRFVISSRPGFYESIRNDFKLSKLEKLTDEKIQTFIEKYVTDREFKAILIDKILNNQHLKSLLTNPMLLFLAIKVARKRKEDNIKDLLPSSSSEMYEAFVSGLFSHYFKKKGKNLLTDRIQIINSLANLYFYLQCWNKVSCEYSKALEIVAKYAEDPIFGRTTAQGILRDCFRLGLLVENDMEIDGIEVKYGIHQSFQEYFAALMLKDLFENGFDISAAFSHPKWEKVVIFASEMLDPVDGFINMMLSKGELSLASKCVNRASNETKEKLCTLLDVKVSSKYTLEKLNSIGSLGRIGISGIDILIEALKDNDLDVRRRATYALVDINSELAVQPLINALKGNYDREIFLQVIYALGKFKSEKTDKVIDLLRNDSEYYSMWNIMIRGLYDKDDEEAIRHILYAMRSSYEYKNEDEYEYLWSIEGEQKGKNKNTQLYVSNALSNYLPEVSTQSLIDALDDSNFDVRTEAAETLLKNYTVVDKKQIEGLMESENSFSANIAFKILYKIDNEEKSKIRLFDELFPYRISVVDNRKNESRNTYM